MPRKRPKKAPSTKDGFTAMCADVERYLTAHPDADDQELYEAVRVEYEPRIRRAIATVRRHRG